MTTAAAEWVSPSALKPWGKNPRKNDPAVVKVAAAIERFGFGAPIVARKETGEIIAGHTRWKAAQKLGLEQVPVRFLELSEDEAHALALADNRLGELASWDNDLLREVLADLPNTADLGWADEAVQLLINPGAVEDVAWKTFDETIGDGAPTGKTIRCPHCQLTFEK